MRIIKSEFKQSLYLPDQYKPGGYPEIAVVGRSNGGKSSLINALCGKKIARISQQPGKTRSINAYCINDTFLLMDLPGYGYAKRTDAETEQWRLLIEGYFESTKTLAHILLLCDIRHEPSDDDVQMVQWIRFYSIPYTLVATKADKIAKNQQSQHVKSMLDRLGFSPSLCFSQNDVRQKEQLLAHLFRILAGQTKND
jgi:GTP-binding protein